MKNGKTKKGTNEFFLYNTFENSHIFYPANFNYVPVDTLSVSSEVRDRKGGGKSAKPIIFILKQNKVVTVL